MPAGCGDSTAAAELRTDSLPEQGLNAELELSLDGDVDPLSINDSSVRLLREDGSSIPIEVGVAGGQLHVEVVATPELLAEHLRGAWLQLAGLPSPQALATLDGRRLRSSVRRRLTLLPMLRAAGTEPPRLVALNGQAPGSEPLTVNGTLSLSFDGVLDPATVTAAACPLFPIVGDLRLPTAVQPQVRWRCVGGRFELLLDVPPATGRLQMVLRRLGVRDAAGRGPEPAGLVVDLTVP